MSYRAMTSIYPNQRPFVLSRSTFPGSGRYTAHWTGDNTSSWAQLRWSIVALLDFNIFGIPWVGADVCGFEENTTDELCIRWHQAAVFYPFFRNHNDVDTPRDQDPASFQPATRNAIRKAIRFRYTLLHYLNFLMQDSHSRGTPVVRALWFEWPTETQLLDIDDQILWGSSLMAAPVMDEGALSRRVTFPPGNWYRLPDQPLISQLVTLYPGNRTVDIPVPLNSSCVFIRAGSIIPMSRSATTTFHSRRKPIALLIALSEDGSSRRANGKLYLDDDDNNGYKAKFEVKATISTQNVLHIVIQRTSFTNSGPHNRSPVLINKLIIYHGNGTKMMTIKVLIENENTQIIERFDVPMILKAGSAHATIVKIKHVINLLPTY